MIPNLANIAARAMADIVDATMKKKWDLAAKESFPDSAPANIVMTADTVREDQEKLRRAIEEKRKVEAQGEEASKRASMKAAMRDRPSMASMGGRVLTKEQAEQLATGKIPPNPGDELPISEWMRMRDGRPTAKEEAQAQKTKDEQMQVAAMMRSLKETARPFMMMPKLTPDLPKKRTAKPDKTTEEAQRELTETGRRKIILDEDK